MKRGWFLLLALSVGLNVGLLYSALFGARGAAQAVPEPAPAFIEGGPAPPPDAPPCESCDAPCGERLLRLTRHLELGEEQHAHLAQVLDKTMPQIIAARASVQEARRAVQAEYNTDRPDPARVHTAVRAMNAAQARLDSLVAETMLQEIGVLTPEQMHRYLERLPWARCGGPTGSCPPGPGKPMEGRRGRSS